MATNNPDTEQDHFGLWTADDVARWAKVSRSWVYGAASAGRIPCIKMGGLLRFDPQSIKSFFLSGTGPGRKVIPLKSTH